MTLDAHQFGSTTIAKTKTAGKKTVKKKTVRKPAKKVNKTR